MASNNGGRAAAKRPTRQATRLEEAAAREAAPLAWAPTRVFFTSGVGTHETRRVAMQRAMEEAGVADCNLVKVSSVIPPRCEIITREHGLRLLRPGNIVYAVLGQASTNEPHQRVTAALCWAQPESDALPGYVTEIEEDETKGKSARTATDEAGEALLTIVAEKVRAKVDAKKLWSRRGRDRRVRVGRTTVRVGSLAATAVGPEQRDGKQLHAVAIVMAVYV
jgi:arginine decarboxylase